MSVKDIDLLEFAVELSSTAKCEASYRNIVSKAYYAVYHKADNFHKALPTPGTNAREAGVHSTLAERLCSPTVSCAELAKKSKIAGYICRDLHMKRVDADYKLDLSINRDDAEYSLNTAERFFSLL